MKQTNLLTKLLLLCLCVVGSVNVAWGATKFSFTVKNTVSDTNVSKNGGTLSLNTTTHLDALSGGTITLKNTNASSDKKMLGTQGSGDYKGSIILSDGAKGYVIVELDNAIAEGVSLVLLRQVPSIYA